MQKSRPTLADPFRRAAHAAPLVESDLLTAAAKRGVGMLLDAGVRVFEWQPSMFHAKTFVADGQWSTIGSMNFDNRSMALNGESTLMILDSIIGRQMDQVFLDDLRHAEEILRVQHRAAIDPPAAS